MDTVVQNPNGTYSLNYAGFDSLFIPTSGLTGYNRSTHTGYGNITLLWSSDECSLATCDLTLAPIQYVPKLPANTFFAGLFGLLIIINIFMGIRYKTRVHMVVMVIGLSGEIVGYIGRILLHQSPFDPSHNAFLIYLAPLTIAPAFFSAAIYLCLSRIAVLYGGGVSRMPARFYTWVFCTADFISLLLQASGGAIASIADSLSQTQLGINIMLAGLTFQVVSLLLFITLCIDLANRALRARKHDVWPDTASELYDTKLFKSFLIGTAVATFAIVIRSAYRIAELSGGFHGHLANDQITFIILEGAMIALATILLSLLNPGMCFQGYWSDAHYKAVQRKN